MMLLAKAAAVVMTLTICDPTVSGFPCEQIFKEFPSRPECDAELVVTRYELRQDHPKLLIAGACKKEGDRG